MIMYKTKVNKNATVRHCREQQVHARHKAHEQRKPKKKRKWSNEDMNTVICTKEAEQISKEVFQTSNGGKQLNTNKGYQTCKLEIEQYLSNPWNTSRSGILFRKVMHPRAMTKSPKIIPPIPVIVRPETVICYPVFGASYSKPAVPTADVSYPTQVSEQHPPNTDEVVFSNGRSIRVEHGSSNHTVNNHQTPNVSNGYGSPSRHQDQDHNFARNPVHGQLVEQNVHKRPPKPPRYPEHTVFDQRLKSYARWWKQWPNPVALCEAGFFYTNKEDLVRCYQCGIGLKDFSYGDNPLNEHVKHSGECPYLQDYLGPEGLAHIKRQVQTVDHKNNGEMQPGLSYQVPTSSYRHPEYKTYAVRVSSFSGWPPSLIQTPHQLAEAGLYYTGFEDNVRCFACDGGLRKWDPEDDPWIEHCRWFPECTYAKQEKGEEYIALVQTASASEIEDRLGKGTAVRNNITGNDITSEIERLTLRDPELNAVISEHRETCLEMGYSEKEFNIATNSLAKKGNVRPSIEDILDAIGVEKQKLEVPAAPPQNETPAEENSRLKSMIFCAYCKVKQVNALFLPCTHHRLCLDCAQPLTQCPFCDRNIRQTIKTYLV